MISTVFLDLDGTLTDSRRGILYGASYALRAFGIPVPWNEVTTEFIGPPLYDSFRRYYGLSDADARRAVELYREYYGREGLFENEVYPGISEMLAALKEAGLALYLATGKPHPYARRIVDHFGLDRYLDGVFGAEFDGTRGDKAELLAYAMGELGILPSEAVMVGDRRFDMEGACSVGVTPVGVLWGYGDRQELIAAGGHLLAESPHEAGETILSLLK